MRSHVTSYSDLFSSRVPDTPVVERIEIPLIQRDYAQGRESESVRRIRNGFLEVLHRALTGGEDVGLDFVYGAVEEGTLRPLDGQQRLTTLFRLNWYLSFRANTLNRGDSWTSFSYATRPGARLFCERLVRCERPDGDVIPWASMRSLSEWIQDQAWYLATWRHDPTIRSMLVMLDAIDERFGSEDHGVAWTRLVRERAITFHLLPIDQSVLGSGEELYVRMNSRGRPLTPFENFKALFEHEVSSVDPEKGVELAKKFDGEWADVFWIYRGDDDLIDDEFLRQLGFLTDICQWLDGGTTDGELLDRASNTFARGERSSSHRDFLFRSLDTWIGCDVGALFGDLFTRAHNRSRPELVTLFPRRGTGSLDAVDLFEACCRRYGAPAAGQREFSLQDTLLLFAVLLHRTEAAVDVARRLRVLRNMLEASENELRRERMPQHVKDVEQLMYGELDDVTSLNSDQREDESRKVAFLQDAPDLKSCLLELEDHPILRGCLTCIELDSSVFERRVTAFQRLFADEASYPQVADALLTFGDFSRKLQGQAKYLFGGRGGRERWRELMTGGGEADLAGLRGALGELLDEVATSDCDVSILLDRLKEEWLESAEDAREFSWRWYFVRYGLLHVGRTGMVVTDGGSLSYRRRILDATRLNGRSWDAILYAIWRACDRPSSVEEPCVWTTNQPVLTLGASEIAIGSIDEGFTLSEPRDQYREIFDSVCLQHSVGDDRVLRIKQRDYEGERVDAEDRVMRGVRFITDAIDAGL